MNKMNKHSPSFGWHYPMHAKILKTAAKTNVIDSKALKTLAKSVQKPDLDEFFLYGQSHFYYPNDIIKSYLDITRTHNAKYAFNKHIAKMNKAFDKKDKETGLDEAGRALHYLQDMTQPNHIESGSIIQKAKDKKMHADFEMFSFSKQDSFCQESSSIKINADNLDSLFNETIKMNGQILARKALI